MSELTSADLRFLRAVKRSHEDGFDGLSTGRKFRRVTAQRLLKAGLVSSEWMHIGDGDGGVNEERAMREAYALTEAGREALAAAGDSDA